MEAFRYRWQAGRQSERASEREREREARGRGERETTGYEPFDLDAYLGP